MTRVIILTKGLKMIKSYFIDGKVTMEFFADSDKFKILPHGGSRELYLKDFDKIPFDDLLYYEYLDELEKLKAQNMEQVSEKSARFGRKITKRDKREKKAIKSHLDRNGRELFVHFPSMKLKGKKKRNQWDDKWEPRSLNENFPTFPLQPSEDDDFPPDFNSWDPD